MNWKGMLFNTKLAAHFRARFTFQLARALTSLPLASLANRFFRRRSCNGWALIAVGDNYRGHELDGDH